MPIGVHYVPLGIELNLSLPDLGHPDIPDLREQVLAEPAQVGIFQCVHYARGVVRSCSVSVAKPSRSAVRTEECGRRGPCTHRGARRPCPGRQAFWDPNRSTFDRILIAMAKQWLVGAPIDGNWWLIPVPDRDRYLELGGQLVERQPRRPALHTGTPRPIEAHCTFGVDTGARAAPRPRLDRTGPLTATIPEPRTAAPAAVERPARRACQPCVYGCPEPAQLYPCGWRCDTHRPQRSGT